MAVNTSNINTVSPWSAVMFCRLGVKMSARADANLPDDLAAIWRGSIGAALHTACCQEGCEGDCSYHYLMETPLPSGATSLRGYSHLPHPIVIRPPQASGVLGAGEQIAFEVILVGRAVDRFADVIQALRLMGQEGLGKNRVRFDLDQVCQVTQDTSGFECERILWDASAELTDHPVSEHVPESLHGTTGVAIHWLSPVHIVSSGRMLRDLPFTPLVRALLRRMSSLALFHCQQELTVDYRGMIAQSQQIQNTKQQFRIKRRERFSSRQQRVLPLVGLLGDVQYRGAEMSDFIPLLRLGEVLHVGKGTVFGMGQYRMRIHLSENR